MTRRATTVPSVAVRICWTTTLARMEAGERLLVHGKSHAQVGAAIAKFNRDGKRFVSKGTPQGVYVIRVA